MASSSSARIIPWDSTPRSLERFSRAPSGITAPGSATATVWPAATLGAPQTICATSPSPVETRQTDSRSASGCCSRSSTRPTTKLSSAVTPCVKIAVDLGAGQVEPLGQLGRREPRIDVVRHPEQGQPHPNCSSSRRSFSKNIRRSGTPCLRKAIRSIPMPQAKPWCFSAS